MSDFTGEQRAHYLRALGLLYGGEADARRRAVSELIAEDAVWTGFAPLDALSGRDAQIERLWQPLHRSFEYLRRRDDIFMMGRYQDQSWISATGYLLGNFTRDWLGIPASGKLAYLRFGEFHRLRDGLVVETAMQIDVLDLMRQTGYTPLAAEYHGAVELIPGPLTHDGLRLIDSDPAVSEVSLKTVETMLLGLATPDRRWMPYWRQDMLWYGPCGIGTSFGIPDFDTFQVPFEKAFEGWGGGIHGHTSTRHTTRFADGLYVTSGGFPSVTGVQVGRWLGFEPSNQRVFMRVMDWWRRDGDLLAENWVMIDMPHVLGQLGLDVFAAVARPR